RLQKRGHKLGIAAARQGWSDIAPQRSPPRHPPHETRPILQSAGVHPRAGNVSFDEALKVLRIAPRQPRDRAALLQIYIGEKIDAPRMQSRSQRRASGGAGTGAKN